MYFCDLCDYSSLKFSNINKHKNRKKPCNEELNEKLVQPTKEDISICDVCEKTFSRKDGLKEHKKRSTCDKLHKLQCKTCLKFFAGLNGKYKHYKNVKCSPPENDVFFNEELVQVLRNDTEYNLEMEKNIKKGCHDILGGVVNIVKFTYLDPEFPQNQTIKKIKRKDTHYLVKQSLNWVPLSNNKVYFEILKAIKNQVNNFIVDLPYDIRETNSSLYLSINKFLSNLGKIGLDMKEIRERFIQNNSFLLSSYHSFPEKRKEDKEIVSEPTKFMKGLQNKISDVFYEHFKSYT
jgi:hypothetical protein